MNPDAGREIGQGILAALGWVWRHPILVSIVIGVLIFIPLLLADWMKLRSHKPKDETVRGGEARSVRELRRALRRKRR